MILVICAAIGSAYALFVYTAIYQTFFQGRTAGPNFVAAVCNGQVGNNDVKSVEVIVPPQGHDAFSEREYDSLERMSVIDSPPAIAELLACLGTAKAGHVSQNHPQSIYRSYWRINLVNGEFYYLYVDVTRDATDTICFVDANNKNARNPNGATLYHVRNFRSMLRAIDEHSDMQLFE